MKKTILFILFFPLVPLTEIIIRYFFVILNVGPRNNFLEIIFSIVTAILVALIMNYLNIKFHIHASKRFLLIPPIIFLLFVLLSSVHPAISANLLFHVIFETIIYMILVNNKFLKSKVESII